MTYVAVLANQRTQNHTYYLWRQNLWERIRGRAMNTDLDTYCWFISDHYKSTVITDGSVTIFKLGSSSIHPVRTYCTRITIFKHCRYSYRS